MVNLRLRRLGAAALLLLIAVAVLLLARYLHARGFAWAANFSNIASAVLAAIALLIPVVAGLVRSLRSPPPISRMSIPQIRDDFALTLAREWGAEERWRRINDPRPMPVRWQITPTADTPSRVVGGRFDEIMPHYMRLPSPRRMIILGDAGAGKSVLVLRLARDLLTAREGDMPVPVIVSAAGWNPDRDLQDWLGEQLCQNHPGLALQVKDSTGGLAALGSILVADRMVLPIIDGLDELAKPLRSKAIAKINEFGSDFPLVVTSRPEEYIAAAAETGRGISRSTTVRVLPLGISQAKEYLSEATAGTPTDRWSKVFSRLDKEPGDPLVRLLCTPLMLSLARIVYENGTTQPGELIDRSRFVNAAALEDHLLNAFVPAVYASAVPTQQRRFRCRIDQAERWLGFLAAHLNHIDQSDFAWWQLDRATPCWRIVAAGFRTVLTVSSIWAITSFLLARYGTWRHGRYTSHMHWHSVLAGGPLGKEAWPATSELINQTKQQVFAALSPVLHFPLLPWVSLPGFEVYIAFCGILGGYWSIRNGKSSVPRTFHLKPLYMTFGIIRGVVQYGATALVVTSLLLLFFQNRKDSISLTGFFGLGSTQRAILGYSILGAVGITSYLLLSKDISRSVSPAKDLRADRRSWVAARGLRSALVILTFWLWSGAVLAAAYGLYLIIVNLVRVIFGDTVGASDRYIAARIYLFACRRSPWRVVSFLEDARRRGVLRQVGAVYQFRHIRLQERLASNHPLMFNSSVSRLKRKLNVPDTLDFSSALDLFIGLQNHDHEIARLYGWQVSIGDRRSWRKYRDPRFDTKRAT